MNNTGVIDHFLDVFTRYIDSGFGLLQPEIAWLATTLIAVDVTLAALFWTWGEGEDIVARLVKKTLFVGVFAYLIGNWNSLTRIVFESFAGLGLKASGTSLALADFLRPGRIAQVGLDAAHPLLDAIAASTGLTELIANLPQIMILLVAWAIVILSFFVLAIQLFVALIEFKLTSLAGFVLVPFGLFGKTAFMAERVLGNVVSSGIKVLVLAVIVGIGSTLFAEFTAGAGGAVPTVDDALAIVLASLSLLALGIFGPGIANGIVSGGPQLSAGAAVGTGLAAGGAAFAAAGAARIGASVAGSALDKLGRGAAHAAGATTGAYQQGGVAGVAKAGASAAASPLRRAAEAMRGAFNAGASGQPASSASASTPGGAPPWANAMRRRQQLGQGVGLVTGAIRSGDGGGAGSAINLSEGG